MFFHAYNRIPGISSWINLNHTREEILYDYICPFVRKDVTLIKGELINFSSYGDFVIFQTKDPIDSDWPIKQSDYDMTDGLARLNYEEALKKFLRGNTENITLQLYREALILLETGEYDKIRNELLQDVKGKFSFFICPLDDNEIDHNYEFAIKPVVKQYQFSIQKANEISNSGSITDKIIEAINHSRFLIADLTNARPNCYYEVGYAHAIGKPVILIAKTGTERHFDIAEYNWNYWDDYTDLKPKMEKAVDGVLHELNLL